MKPQSVPINDFYHDKALPNASSSSDSDDYAIPNHPCDNIYPNLSVTSYILIMHTVHVLFYYKTKMTS